MYVLSGILYWENEKLLKSGTCSTTKPLFYLSALYENAIFTNFIGFNGLSQSYSLKLSDCLCYRTFGTSVLSVPTMMMTTAGATETSGSTVFGTYVPSSHRILLWRWRPLDPSKCQAVQCGTCVPVPSCHRSQLWWRPLEPPKRGRPLPNTSIVLTNNMNAIFSSFTEVNENHLT